MWRPIRLWKGYWESELSIFAPPFAFLNIGSRQRAASSSVSDSLFCPDGSTEYYRRDLDLAHECIAKVTRPQISEDSVGLVR
jgi:hypothetical protein